MVEFKDERADISGVISTDESLAHPLPVKKGFRGRKGDFLRSTELAGQMHCRLRAAKNL